MFTSGSFVVFLSWKQPGGDADLKRSHVASEKISATDGLTTTKSCCKQTQALTMKSMNSPRKILEFEWTQLFVQIYVQFQKIQTPACRRTHPPDANFRCNSGIWPFSFAKSDVPNDETQAPRSTNAEDSKRIWCSQCTIQVSGCYSTGMAAYVEFPPATPQTNWLNTIRNTRIRNHRLVNWTWAQYLIFWDLSY